MYAWLHISVRRDNTEFERRKSLHYAHIVAVVHTEDVILFLLYINCNILYNCKCHDHQSGEKSYKINLPHVYVHVSRYVLSQNGLNAARNAEQEHLHCARLTSLGEANYARCAKATPSEMH